MPLDIICPLTTSCKNSTKLGMIYVRMRNDVRCASGQPGGLVTLESNGDIVRELVSTNCKKICIESSARNNFVGLEKNTSVDR